MKDVFQIVEEEQERGMLYRVKEVREKLPRILVTVEGEIAVGKTLLVDVLASTLEQMGHVVGIVEEGAPRAVPTGVSSAREVFRSPRFIVFQTVIPERKPEAPRRGLRAKR